jgi:hypothetical protein
MVKSESRRTEMDEDRSLPTTFSRRHQEVSRFLTMHSSILLRITTSARQTLRSWTPRPSLISKATAPSSMLIGGPQELRRNHQRNDEPNCHLHFGPMTFSTVKLFCPASVELIKGRIFPKYGMCAHSSYLSFPTVFPNHTTLLSCCSADSRDNCFSNHVVLTSLNVFPAIAFCEYSDSLIGPIIVKSHGKSLRKALSSCFELSQQQIWWYHLRQIV